MLRTRQGGKPLQGFPDAGPGDTRTGVWIEFGPMIAAEQPRLIGSEEHAASAIEWEVPVWTTVHEHMVRRVVMDNDVRTTGRRRIAGGPVNSGLFQDRGGYAKVGHAFPSHGDGCRTRELAGRCHTVVSAR